MSTLHLQVWEGRCQNRCRICVIPCVCPVQKGVEQLLYNPCHLCAATQRSALTGSPVMPVMFVLYAVRVMFVFYAIRAMFLYYAIRAMFVFYAIRVMLVF